MNMNCEDYYEIIMNYYEIIMRLYKNIMNIKEVKNILKEINFSDFVFFSLKLLYPFYKSVIKNFTKKRQLCCETWMKHGGIF